MLEAIIDLLMQNIFFVILIIGGILSFFKRQIEKQNEQQQRPGRVGQREQQQHRSETISVPTEERARPERQWKDRGKDLETNLQELYETKREELRISAPENAPRAKRPSTPIAQKRSKPTSNQLLPNPDHIAQGVIWSEVLGPPRSRKPHRVAANLRRK